MEYTIGSTAFTNWEIIKELGEGATGKVFEIHKTDYGITTKSALKVIRVPHSAADLKAALAEGMDEQSVSGYFQGFVDEIVKEIVIMSELKSHPNIVSYEDHQVTPHKDSLGWDILIRMELLTPLLDYQLNHTITEADVIRMGRELTSALVFCQGKGLMHRDIKPENIFVSEAGQFKLGDFGVARTVEKTTGGLSRKGTEKYMAPEVYLGKSYNQTADLYSLGLVLYSFLNRGRLPFYPLDKNQISFADRESAMDRRMRGDAVPAPADASPELAAVILKACAYRAEDRYQTAADMLAALEKVTFGNEKKSGYRAAEFADGSEEKTVGMGYTEPEEKTVGMEYTEPEEKTVGMGYTEPEEKTVGMEYTEPEEESAGTSYDQQAEKTAQSDTAEKEENKIPEKGKDVYQEINLDAGLAQKGGTQSMLIKGKTVLVTIPAGIKEGQQIRLRGLGESGINGGASGDVYIRVHINPQTTYTSANSGTVEDEKKNTKASETKKTRTGKKIKWTAVIIPVLVFAVVFAFAFNQAQELKYEQEKDSAFSSASYSIDDGQYEDAIAMLTDLVDKYPEDYRGYEYLAEAYAELGQYDEALAVLDDGKAHAEDGDFSSQYDEISQKKEYTEAIASAEENAAAGDYEQAQADYQTAIEIDAENVQAYQGMTDLYISQGKYDDGVVWLDSAACDYDTKTGLQAKCLLAKVDKMMNNGDYEGLLNFFKTDRNSKLAGVTTYYYQDGQVRDNIEGGKGLILSTWGVYSGNIVNGSREGSGKQFGIFTDEDKVYTLTEGQWSGNKANGQCTYTYRDLADESQTEVITGNVKDNMLDGDLTIRRKMDNGQEQTFSAHADNGTYSLIRNENGKYVYMENSSGWYGYYETEEELKNHGVWAGY